MMFDAHSAWRAVPMRLVALAASACLLAPLAMAQEQDDESKALDSTATQWSAQFAYQQLSYKSGTLDNGQPRPQGLDNFFQARVVAPVALENMTILPRLTLRHYENESTGESGIGNTEVFGLMIPKGWDWGTGRFGVGPLLTLPGNDKVARDEWGYGVAAAIVNTSGNWFYGLLFTQSWRSVDPSALPTGSTDRNPLGIAPFLNYRLGNGWYVGNGDMVAQWDWESKELYLPIGVRFGRVLLKEKGTWNLYGEYQTSLVYQNYPGPTIDKSVRLNLTYTWQL